jgi:predicted permease
LNETVKVVVALAVAAEAVTEVTSRVLTGVLTPLTLSEEEATVVAASRVVVEVFLPALSVVSVTLFLVPERTT